MLLVCSSETSAGLFKTPHRAVTDNQRRGLIFSHNLGGGWSQISSERGGLTGEITKGALAITSKIGYTPNNRILLYLTMRQSVYTSKLKQHANDYANWSNDGRVGAYVSFVLFLPIIAIFVDQHTLGGIGRSNYFRPEAPWLYIDAGAGGAYPVDPYESEGLSSFLAGGHGGSGFYVALGYEFARHIQLDQSIMWSKASWDTASGRREWSGMSVMLTTGFLAY